MVNGALLIALWLVAALANYFAFLEVRAGHPVATALILLAQAPFAIFALVRNHRDGVLGERLGPRAGDPTKGILLAVLTYALSAGVAYLAFPPNTELGTLLARFYLHFGDPGALRRATLASTGMIFLVASTEELAFRGLATDLLAELTMQGHSIEPVMRSAAEFVATWRRATAKIAPAAPTPTLNRTLPAPPPVKTRLSPVPLMR